ncbi:MAG: N-acetylmuramoyl-L-alanine amidase [Actinomycetota bacterium]|nr:N-acetylmuramoyl-L-alanine amidase [Actinomycetota bacterium]
MTLPRVFTLTLLLAVALTGSAPAGVRVVSRDEPLKAARTLADGERVLPARAAPLRFNLVGLHWRGSGEVWFRTASPTGRWSRWHEARPEAEDGPDRTSNEAKARTGWRIGNPYWTGPAQKIQYRLAGRVGRLRAHFVWSAPRTAPRQVASARAPQIITRAGWGADESIVPSAPWYAERLAFAVVHHTAGGSPSTPAESAAIVRGIQRYHVLSNGWNDIGYNFLVDRFGQVFEGRGGGVGRNVVGAHAQGFNSGSVGVAVIGTYGSSSISAEAKAALVSLLAWRLDVGHVDPASRLAWTSAGSPQFPAGTRVWLNAVSGHRDVGLTSCPGSILYGDLGDIAAKAAARGLPKIYSPRYAGALGGPIRFTARLSTSAEWKVTVFDALGAAVASGTGTGTAVDWTWDTAALTPGRYSYSVEAGTGFLPAQGPIGASLPLELTSLRASPPVVTPNGDGVGETSTAAVTVSVPAYLRAWLEDESETRVATVMRLRSVPAGTTRVRWDPAALADGRYRIVAEATSGTEQVTRTAAVVVDRTLGNLAVAPEVFSPNGDGSNEASGLGFDLAREADATARVLAGTGTLATLYSGSLAAPGRQTALWDGKLADGSTAADGRYRMVVSATTSLGTRWLTKGVVVDTVSPRVSRLAASRYRGRTLARFVLSERARVRLSTGGTVVRVMREAGVRRAWIPATGRVVRASARDAGGNASRAVWARVRAG